MTLRTTALIAGALGLLLLIGGLIADAMRPASFGTPRAAVDTAVVLVGPDMVATAPGGSVTFEGTGDVVAYVGRTEDVEAWASSRDVTVVTGIPDWEQLSVTRDDAMQPEASASPSASASPAASTSPSPSASPAESASPSPSAEPEVAPQIADIWRQTWDSNGSLELETVEISPGLTLVAESVDGSPLVAVQMTLNRAVDDAWISPLKWWGAVLAFFGLVALVSLLIDMRGARTRVETSVAERKPAAPAKPGGRRERREAMTATGGIPVVAAPEEPWTGEIPRVDDADGADADGADANENQADPPGSDDEEGRS